MRLLLVSLFLLSASGCAAGPPPPRAAGHGGAPPRSGLFISPMGEPFRSSQPGADLAGRWFGAADADGDGRLVLAEMEADALRFFGTLDVDADGEIEPDEMRRYENEIVPELRLARPMGAGIGGGGGPGVGPGGARRRGPDGPSGGVRRRGGPGGPGGAGLLGPLNLPQPVAAADADMNRGVSRDEFRRAAGQRLVLLDRSRDGALAPDELVPAASERRRRR